MIFVFLQITGTSFNTTMMNWTWQKTIDVMIVIWMSDFCLVALYLITGYIKEIIRLLGWELVGRADIMKSVMVECFNEAITSSSWWVQTGVSLDGVQHK